MFSFTGSSRQTTYERLTMSPEPGPPGYHPKANTLWHRLFSTRFSTRRTRRNVVLVVLASISLVTVVVLVLYGPLLYRILELPSYRRYRDAENLRRPVTVHLSGDGSQEGKDDVKYFFPEKRLIGALILYLWALYECIVHTSCTLTAVIRCWLGKYSSRANSECSTSIRRQQIVRSSFMHFAVFPKPPHSSRSVFLFFSFPP